LNEENFKRFWYWVDERHLIYLKKEAGEPKPWSRDHIFQKYKFTNVFRELDTGTVWLRKNFFEQYPYAENGVLLFNVTWYRMFNFIPTARIIGWTDNWNRDKVKDLLEHEAQVFTGAHMVRGGGGCDGMSKLDDVLRTLDNVWEMKDRVAEEIIKCNTLEHAFNLLNKFRLIGGFLGYEIVTDLTHTSLLTRGYDLNTWANIGPGARRGINRIWPDTGGQHEYLARARELLAVSKDHKAPHVPDMTLRDIEHSLCEFSKWCKAFYGEGRPRGLYNGV